MLMNKKKNGGSNQVYQDQVTIEITQIVEKNTSIVLRFL